MKTLLFLCLVGTTFALESCSSRISESVPQGMPQQVPLTTSEAWIELLNNTKRSVDIASFYWTLTGGDEKFGGEEGQAVFDAIVAAAKRGVQIRIVQSAPSASMPDNDTALLTSQHLASVRNLDMSALFGGGVQHSKFWIFDDDALWIGSANMDWRSLTQVKELGVAITYCPTLAADLGKLFEAYWIAADKQSLPSTWPLSLSTHFSLSSPANILLNNEAAEVFFASSPKKFCPSGRTFDLDAIVETILAADKTVSIEVMDYLPASVFLKKNIYWPAIDDAIRLAAFENHVNVKFLIGNWSNSDPAMFPFLESLRDISKACVNGSVEVKLYNLPADPHGVVPYTRVNHAKFMVTEESAFIGTSNWQADYFIDTGGASFNCRQERFVKDLQAVFDRDWNSQFAVPL